MNKKQFCSQILQTIDNARGIDGASDDEIIETLEGFMDLLTPVNRERFAKWGLPEHQTTVDKCWEAPS